MRISDWSSDVCSSDLPLVGDLVWHWHRGAHAKVALGIRHEFSAVVVHGDVVVDPAVQAIRRRVPHVDDSAGERLARVRPIESAGSLVGALGVSGAPGGDADAVCAKPGIAANTANPNFFIT